MLDEARLEAAVQFLQYIGIIDFCVPMCQTAGNRAVLLRGFHLEIQTILMREILAGGTSESPVLVETVGQLETNAIIGKLAIGPRFAKECLESVIYHLIVDMQNARILCPFIPEDIGIDIKGGLAS